MAFPAFGGDRDDRLTGQGHRLPAQTPRSRPGCLVPDGALGPRGPGGGPCPLDDGRHLLGDRPDLGAVRDRRIRDRDAVGAIIHRLRGAAVHLRHGRHLGHRDDHRGPGRAADRLADHGDPASPCSQHRRRHGRPARGDPIGGLRPLGSAGTRSVPASGRAVRGRHPWDIHPVPRRPNAWPELLHGRHHRLDHDRPDHRGAQPRGLRGHPPAPT